MMNYHKKRDVHIATSHSNVSATQSTKILKKSHSDKNMMIKHRPPMKKSNEVEK